MNLHPEVLALIEAGPQRIIVDGITGRFATTETPQEFARRIAEAAVRIATAELRARLEAAERDVIVLCLRLCMEPNNSHSPDTADVLHRWRKAWEAAAGGMPIDAAIAKEGK